MKKHLLIAAGLSLIVNLILVLMIINITQNQLGKISSAQIGNSEQFPYLSKRIFVANQNDIIINFIPLKQALNDYVRKQNGKVGVYFEYLPSGTSIGVNSNDEVKIASLSKVPIVMSIFKKIERGHISLSDVLVIKKENIDKDFGDLWKRGEGTKLSVEELINLSLIESDNTAYKVLLNALTPQEVNEVYEGLDIQITQAQDYQLVSPKNYSSIFRSLYLSSFLSEKNSQRVLQILTQTIFNDKIPAGVPKNIPIAHKIGVFTEADTSKDIFIDCGIVYVPNRPYILCAFVKDADEQAQKHISYISNMVYGFIVAVKGGN